MSQEASAAAQNAASAIRRTPEGVVVVSLSDLLQEDPPADLSASIKEAFGNHETALGVILISDIPEYPTLRTNLLMQASILARTQASIKERLTTDVKYQVGWSHGIEIMNGKPDTDKGSYYANPLKDNPGEDVDEETRHQYPMYYHPNIWPTELECPAFENDFKQLGSMIAGLGFLLARHCDTYAENALNDYPKGLLAEALEKSDTTKGRLLHYFAKKPTDPSTLSPEEAAKQVPASEGDPLSWCGWHLDHSLLTGLTAAMYIDETSDFRQVDCPDPESGLYVKLRSGKITRVRIPEDHIAFQAGEALQVSTSGQLQGTWHCVRAPRVDAAHPAAQVARNTFALFMQPTPNTVLGSSGEKFGDFTRRVLDRHY